MEERTRFEREMEDLGLKDGTLSGLREFEGPPAIKPSKEPMPVPASDPISFARPPPMGSYWPVMTKSRTGRQVAYKAIDGSIIGRAGRMFLANRGERYHVGIDLFGKPGDPIVACEDGRISNFYEFTKGTYALIVQHADVTINYGEVAKELANHPVEKRKLRVGDNVQAGQILGYVGRFPSGDSMCHFETYIPGTRANKRWIKRDKKPRELLNPTKYLLFLQEHGLVISDIRPQVTPGSTPNQTLNLDRAIGLNRKYAQELGWQSHFDRIISFLGFTNYTPDERKFAEAIAIWQRNQGLVVDGILGRNTWSRMRAVIGVDFDMEMQISDPSSISGPCPDVPVPPSRRPRVLVRGSIHSAVREAQRKLNAFHAYRLAAGLSGLRDAPLVEDCIFGRHTFDAVKSFQELVFPGMPVEQDGKIGPHTWAQLDAIALGSGPRPAAQLIIEQFHITDDSFSASLNWDKVIGLDTVMLNLKLLASGLPTATMPPHIRVELSSRAPNRISGSPTLSTPAIFDLTRFGADPVNPNRIIYRTSRPLADVGDFLKVERRLKEVATIVRRGGTSDAEFRRALGWTHRGMATQPSSVGVSTGSESGEIPDAFSLFRSAGAEVIEARVPMQPNWRVPSAVKRLIRSPADVVYYSGHGSSISGKLLIDIENRPCPQHGNYHDWLGPADLIPAWTSPMDLDLLILAGCSVLKIDFSTSPPSGIGLQWARLLSAKGGPLVALLGYQGSAPCDSPNGDRIAKKMAERMAGGSINFAQDWLKINGDNNANNAVAMDSRGYWWIEGTWTGGYDIKGPKPIP